ncbi:MAG: hypothetical protein JO270_02745 [Acidobacteriaceae bacterium]|nr:hypothetical protein [Acidobacteriaceae bacterium]MBV8569250.1 hypothetical protein [Acidobacteriaceae bacterium]
MVKPVFLFELCHTTVVPAATQNGALAFAPGMPGVIEAELAVRLTSIVQGADEEPQVLLGLQMLCGFGSAHT